MAFAMTNVNLTLPTAVATVPAYKVQLADQGASGTETDLGAGTVCKYIRGRVVVKSGLSNGNTFTFRVLVDDAASVASPERVYTSPAMAFVTNDTYLSQDFTAASQTGFRYFKIVGTDSGGTAVYDAVVECY